MANPFAPPALDFSPLANLGETFFSAYDRGVKRRQEDEAPGIVDEFIRSVGTAPPPAPSLSINGLGGSAPQTPPASAAPVAQPGRAPAFAALQGMEPSASLAGMFSDKERQYALPPGYLSRTAALESRFNPNAQNPDSSAGGLFQFTNGTAKQYGLANKFDPIASTDAAARLAADNRAYLTKVLGREPTAGELYLAHQQGAGGAAKLLANPNARAVDVVGADAVRLNGGDENMTAGQFAARWTAKVEGGADLPAPGAREAQYQIPGQGGIAPAQGGAAAQPVNGDLLRRMYANPYTRPLAQDIIRSRLNPQSQFDFQVVGDQLLRVNKRTGAAEVVPGITKPTNQWSRLNDGTLYNQVTGETRPVDGAQNGPFTGTSVEAQALNRLVQAGRLTPEQAAEVAAGKPITDPATGQIIFMTPSGIMAGQPASQNMPPVQNAPVTQPQPPQPPAEAQPAPQQRPGAIPLTGTKPDKPTEDQAKNRQLYGRTVPQLQIAEQNFDALSRMNENLASRLPGGDFLTSEQYQRASAAVKDIAASYLYSVSGATANPQEVENLSSTILPRPGEKPATIADKKTRLRQMVESIKERAGYGPGTGPAVPRQDEGWTEINGVKIRRKQ